MINKIELFTYAYGLSDRMDGLSFSEVATAMKTLFTAAARLDVTDSDLHEAVTDYQITGRMRYLPVSTSTVYELADGRLRGVPEADDIVRQVQAAVLDGADVEDALNAALGDWE
jgi:hypothetical protein